MYFIVFYKFKLWFSTLIRMPVQKPIYLESLSGYTNILDSNSFCCTRLNVAF